LVNYFSILREWPSACDLGIATEKRERVGLGSDAIQ